MMQIYREMRVFIFLLIFVISISVIHAQNNPPEKIDPTLYQIATSVPTVEQAEQRSVRLFGITLYTYSVTVSVPVYPDEYVLIDAGAQRGEEQALLTELEALGLLNGQMVGNIISGRLPIRSILALEDCEHLRYARASQPATNTGVGTGAMGGASGNAINIPPATDMP